MKVKKEKNEKKSYKNAKLRERGVTLIALIVTIIIMLILAAIGIRAISGDNGAISKAKETKEMQRGAEVKEYVRINISNNKLSSYLNPNETQVKTKIAEDLYKQGKLTKEEVEKLKEEDVITIGGIEINFGKVPMTLGSVYTKEMRGQQITYSVGTLNNWIIFGQDKDGNILICPASNSTYSGPRILLI